MIRWQRARARTAWFYATVYFALSLAFEITLLAVGRFRIPEDNAIVGPMVLTVPPLIAAWLGAGSRLRAGLLLAGLTAGLTLVFTVVAARLTGIETGFMQPIVVRWLAGFVAALVARRMADPK